MLGMGLAFRASALALLFLFVLSAMRAQTSSEDEPQCTQQGLGKLELSKEDTTILGLGIGAASLKDVEAKLGQADTLPRNGSVSSKHDLLFFCRGRHSAYLWGWTDGRLCERHRVLNMVARGKVSKPIGLPPFNTGFPSPFND